MNLSDELQTITLALVSFFVGVSLTLSSGDIPQQQYLDEVNGLAKKISTLYTTIDELEKELRYYTVTESKLIQIGASPAQAKAIIQASEVYHLNPKP